MFKLCWNTLTFPLNKPSNSPFIPGVSKTRESAGKQIKHLCAFIILVRYIHNILFFAAHSKVTYSNNDKMEKFKVLVNFTVYRVKFAQNTAKRLRDKKFRDKLNFLI